MDLADEGRKYNFQNFQSIASMCLTTDCVPLLTGVTTNPPPAKCSKPPYSFCYSWDCFLIFGTLPYFRKLINIGFTKLGTHLF